MAITKYIAFVEGQPPGEDRDLFALVKDEDEGRLFDSADEVRDEVKRLGGLNPGAVGFVVGIHSEDGAVTVVVMNKFESGWV